MGQNIDQVVEKARGLGDGASVDVTLVTNQDNGFVTYNIGTLTFHAGMGGGFAAHRGPHTQRPDRLSTQVGAPLTRYMSYEMLSIDPPPPAPEPGFSPAFGPSPRQPFSANATEKVGLSLSHVEDITGRAHWEATFTLLSWNDVTFKVSLEARENLLVGVGDPVGSESARAVYVIAFRSPKPGPG
jgi:hypothetical protein